MFGKAAAVQRKVDSLEHEIFEAKQRGVSVVRVCDVIDILLHGKLTAADPDVLFSFADKLSHADQQSEEWCESVGSSCIPHIRNVNIFLVQNMFCDRVYRDQVYISPIKPLQYNFAALSLGHIHKGDYITGLCDFCISLIGVSDGILPMFLERKLTGDEIMFFNTLTFSMALLWDKTMCQNC